MNRIMHQLLNEDSNNFKGIQELLVKYNLTEEYLKTIEGVNFGILYKSLLHGLHHSQKVCLFAMLLAKEQRLDETDMQIIKDASLYHDIGRINDIEDSIHGFASACRIDKVVNHQIYDDPTNLGYLKAIMDAHSRTADIDRSFADYKFDYPDMNIKRFNRLANILLDADALDRTRFYRTSRAALKESYLRLPFAKELVSFAQQINDYYVQYMGDYYFQKYKDKYYAGENQNKDLCCFHGIGWDFFKLNSILENGILSQYAMNKKNINAPRNFYGNNQNLWVSVVNSDSITKNGKAFRKFIENNVCLMTFVPHMATTKKEKQSDSYEQSLPMDSGEYEDEDFVFYKIDKSSIYSIILPPNSQYKSIRNLNYMIGSLNIDIIRAKVEYYYEQVKTLTPRELDKELVTSLLDSYENSVVEFENKNLHFQRQNMQPYFKNLEGMLAQINGVVQQWVETGFRDKLKINKEQKVTVGTVVSHVLQKQNITAANVINEEETIIVINPDLIDVKKKDGEKNKH